MKLKEEVKKWAYAVISFVHNYVMLDASVYCVLQRFCMLCVCVCVGGVHVCKVIIFFPHCHIVCIGVTPSSTPVQHSTTRSHTLGKHAWSHDSIVN